MLELRKKFEKNPYPTNEEYEELSHHLKPSTKRIRTWFYDQRKMIKTQGQHSHHPEQCLNKTRQELVQKKYHTQLLQDNILVNNNYQY